MRGYDEFVGWLLNRLSPQWVLLVLFALTGLVAVLWYWYPAWVPRRMPGMPRFRFPRLRLPRWRFPRVPLRLRLPRWRRRPKARWAPAAAPRPATQPPAPLAEPEPGGLSLADRLAAEGRYAEAIRERLRETVVDLIRAGVITPQPGTTAAELTADASARRPVVRAPLGGATEIFSEIWYGRREASPGHDERMRSLTAEVRASLTPPGGAQ
ncbi:DUF4129 domain-containing protein [Actinoplanes siamensis]|uniref:Protein-glutamine gamma-glutamyltransferase-like C-terminal domain-containing protein n=1 Tax=Actinoplanes siamensis TaxID=1223317 RepID=A0A919K7V7_9ACTN|nr:DUF4129 domain-containing protein [Actinoplanes siamensis]GIF02572.1 hypothetical protein Asi03nite_01100 [Actinoplanes siamensis]